ncbi:MAG: 30S ribosomal protein S15 [Candidatus Improbicoccus devescovinae]|nr:MAG: 30S ribosomal protein S15 [Candidatus Improbicoccus devescovinae]
MEDKKAQKKQVISNFSRHVKDTGSADVQIALLTSRIKKLSEHLKIHKKDNHSKCGLYLMLGQRRRMLNYLMNSKIECYRDIIEKLNIRK